MAGPVTRIGAWTRRTLERLLGRYYEGHTVPRRFAEEVRLFRVMYPMADGDDWEQFAVSFAGSVYRQAFVRGLEHSERTEPPTPEQLAADNEWEAAQLAQDGRMQFILDHGYDPNDPLGGLTLEQRGGAYEHYGAVLGGGMAASVVDDGDPDAVE